MAMLSAILLIVQVALAFLPNIELISLLIILYSLQLGKKVFPVIYVFVLLEGFLYGFDIWWFSYLYVWSLLALFALLCKKQTSVWFWSIFSGFFGLFFGALCSLPYFAIGGVSAAVAYWTAGLGFDLIHCVGNVTVCFALFRPLRYLLQRFCI